MILDLRNGLVPPVADPGKQPLIYERTLGWLSIAMAAPKVDAATEAGPKTKSKAKSKAAGLPETPEPRVEGRDPTFLEGGALSPAARTDGPREGGAAAAAAA